jgi:hypothetical protein
MERRKSKREEREVAILAVLAHGGFGMWGHSYDGKNSLSSSNIFANEYRKAAML